MTACRLKCIACEVLARPVYFSAAHSPHMIDVTLVRYGLHIHPQKLKDHLQRLIHSAEEEADYDAVLLAYGLCGKATDGLQAGRIPIVLPKAHDCITLFLGSRERYKREFDRCPGTYWYVQDFIQRSQDSDLTLSIGANTAANADALYLEYIQKYGQDNANYLMKAMAAWQAHYQRAVYIKMNTGDGQDAAVQAKTDAHKRGWQYEELTGDIALIKKLLFGEWDRDFLKLAPHQRIEMSGGEDIIQAAPARPEKT